MVSFSIWLENDETGTQIKVNLPSVSQNHKYDCGAAVLRAICEYFKVGPKKEADFIKACKTNKKNGTRPADIVRCANQFGLHTKPKTGMSINDLKSILDLHRPVICAIQAYGKNEKYNTPKSGHYVVAIGYDNKHIYFEDPSMEGTRGFLPFKEFNKRWHDKDADGKVCDHLGIVIWKQSGEEIDREFLPQAKKIP